MDFPGETLIEKMIKENFVMIKNLLKIKLRDSYIFKDQEDFKMVESEIIQDPVSIEEI